MKNGLENTVGAAAHIFLTAELLPDENSVLEDKVAVPASLLGD